MTRITRLSSLALIVALAGGCGVSTPNDSALTVRTVANAKTSAKTAAVKTATAIKAPAATAAQMATIARAGAGTVTVDLGARKLMALSDIVTVRLSLTAANGAVQTQSVAYGVSAASFSGVAAGTATLLVEALNAAGTVLGSSSGTASVVANQTAAVNLTVHVAAAAVVTGAVSASIGFVEDGAVLAATPAPAATATPAPAAVGTEAIWGRLYTYAGVQQGAGTVRFVSTNAATPYDQTVSLRADGYYYLPAVPLGVTMQVTASSGALTVSSQYVFSGAGSTYEWLDLFLN